MVLDTTISFSLNEQIAKLKKNCMFQDNKQLNQKKASHGF